MDDANELLLRCQQGDQSALRGLIEQFGGRVFRLANRMLGDRHQAEEAAADAFAKLWQSARKWRGDADAATWIYRIAYHAILDRRRRTKRTWVEPSRDLPDPRPEPPEQSAAVESQKLAAQRVREAVNQLPESDRALVHLYYFDQMGLTEIAAVVGATRDVLKMRLARARQKLRELLGDEEQE